MSSHENETELNEEPKIYNYINVVFENMYYPFSDSRIQNDPDFRRQIYGNARQYVYKTDKFLNRGQIISIKGNTGPAKVLVVNPSLLKEDINFPVDKIKELPIL